MKRIKKIWNYFKGKKRNIGIVGNSIVTGLMLFAPDFLPHDKGMYILGVINLYLLGGAADAYKRSGNMNKDINKLKIK